MSEMFLQPFPSSEIPEALIRAMSEAPASLVAGGLQVEYPQTAALALFMLSGVSETRAAEILAHLPTSYMQEVVRRMALLLPVDKDVAARALRTLAADLHERIYLVPSMDRLSALTERLEAVNQEVAALAATAIDTVRAPDGTVIADSPPRSHSKAATMGKARIERSAGVRFAASSDGSLEDIHLPGSVEVLSAFAASATGTLREYFPHAEADLVQPAVVRFQEYLNSIPLPAMQVVVSVKTSAGIGYGVLVVDSALIYSLTDLLLGGGRISGAMRIEGRPYTRVECDLVCMLVQRIVDDLSWSFSQIAPMTFTLERLETNPTYVRPVAGMGDPCLLGKIAIDLDDRGGRIDVLLPHAILEPVWGAPTPASDPAEALTDAVAAATAYVQEIGRSDLAQPVREFLNAVEMKAPQAVRNILSTLDAGLRDVGLRGVPRRDETDQAKDQAKDRKEDSK